MKNWRKESKNPILPHLRQDRAAFLEDLCFSSDLDRLDYIIEACRSKRVLDVGCVENDADESSREDWLHAKIESVAAYCLGLDVLPDEISTLQGKGYNVQCHDLTQSPFPGKIFDLAICGEIVEHIGNIDGLLRNCSKMLRDGGMMILTTPYPWFIGTTLRHSIRGRYLPGSLEHVAWYDQSNFAELASRHGFQLDAFAGIRPAKLEGGFRRQVFEGFAASIRRGQIPFVAPLTGCRSLLYVLRLASKAEIAVG